MSLQFISDSTGKTIGVHIPIKDWNKIKTKYKGIEQSFINIPDWQIDETRKRLKIYQDNPNEGLDFDLAMEDIEKSL